MGEGSGLSVLSEGKSSRNVLVALYWQLYMGRNDTSVGVKYQNIYLGQNLLNYKYMFVETPIYIKYVVITILIFTSTLVIEFFILHSFAYLLDVSLSTQLSLFLTGLRYILDKV